MKRFALAIAAMCLFAVSALAADPVLPASFAGWELTQSLKHGDNPAQVDPAFPAVLKEYRFHDFESADYRRGDRKITIKVARFTDVTGALGAFTFYRTPEMQREQIGDDAASNNRRILFLHSNLLVDATLDQVTAMSAADLRELANALPSAHGNEATPPNLPGYLPRERIVPGTLKYVLGPNALALVHAPVTAEQINYEKLGSDAEVVMADYADHTDRSTMVIVYYPNAQIATERLNHFVASMQSAPGFVSKRSGDKVILITGTLPIGIAKALVGSVNYDATVSWTEPTSIAPKNNVGNLLIAVFTLIGVLLLIGLGFGAIFGGTRVLFQRVLPGRFHKNDEDEFISLDLR